MSGVQTLVWTELQTAFFPCPCPAASYTLWIVSPSLGRAGAAWGFRRHGFFGAAAVGGADGLERGIPWAEEALKPEALPKRAEPPPAPARASPPEPQDPLWASIPGGSFLMDSDEYDDERPIHTVRISPFQLMRTPVTRQQYPALMGSGPSWPKGAADEWPVNQVSWLDAVAFCNRWSEQEGLRPCYRIEGKQVDWDGEEAEGYRLPTEAEWEYACRAGSATRWCFGDDEAELPEYAWFDKNAGGEPRPVATRKPNAWGLHDMHGNVWEWCWDWYGGYQAVEQDDPLGPEQGSTGWVSFPLSKARKAAPRAMPSAIAKPSHCRAALRSLILANGGPSAKPMACSMDCSRASGLAKTRGGGWWVSSLSLNPSPTGRGTWAGAYWPSCWRMAGPNWPWNSR